MTITTTQKIIKIGTSRGVTLPARDLKQLKAELGDEVRITIEVVDRSRDVLDDYAEFQKQYGETLKNLSQR